MIKSEVRRRLARVLSAQFFNQLVTIVVQVSLVPTLLGAWGVHQYGVWLILSAVPTYLVFSDFGFTLIAKNEMTMAVAAGDRPSALVVFQSVLALLNLVGPIVLVLGCATLWGVDLAALLNVEGYSELTLKSVLCALISNVIVYQYFLLLCAGVRCENRAATESMWTAIARLSDGVTVGLVALLGGGLFFAALGSLVSRLLFSLALFMWLRLKSPWLRLGRLHSDWRVARRLLRPALAFMMMPVSQALLVQGPVLILGHSSGPLLVVIYSATRTLTRMGTACTNLMNASLIAEYSAMYGRRSMAQLRKMLRLHLVASAGLTLTYGIGVLVMCKPLMYLFTHGRVAVQWPFFAFMILAVMAEMVWSSLSIPLSSINRHVLLSYWLMALSVLGIIGSFALARNFGLSGIAIGILLVHATMIFVASVSVVGNLFSEPVGVSGGE